MQTRHNERRASQELLKLAAQLPRLQAEEESARTALLEADAVLDSLDTGSYNGFAARRLQAAQEAARAAQEWHKRARAALEKCERRRERLLMLSRAAA